MSNINTSPTLKTPKKKKEVTLLLLGESGVGKSTFINAFINYLTYPSIESAQLKKPICQIPVKFTVSDQDTLKIHEIKFGAQDSNENTDDSTQSSTQYPKCHKFINNDIILNIIDTPGIADTKGIDNDNKNLRNLLDFISNYREINAICVLLKPTEAKVSVLFKYCLFQLFSHLNKSAVNNILFLFTHARGSNYTPGDTGPVLSKFLKDIKDNPPNVDIEYSNKNIYCFDNEAFRYLLASTPPYNITYKPFYIRQLSASWDRSVKECERLLQHIVSLPPHKVKETLSLNNSRQQILLLTQPLADLSKCISDNQKLCENHKKEIKDFEGTIEELQNKLYVPRVSVISMPLDKPRMVCGDRECCTKQEIDGIVNTHYKKNCHSPCYLSDTCSNVIGDPGLKSCHVFKRGFFFKNDQCHECHHSYLTHLYISYESIMEVKQVRDEIIYEKLTTSQEAQDAKAKQLRVLEKHVKQLSKEQAIISRCMARFVSFLKRNALTPFNDGFESYVRYLIETERVATNNRSTIDKLEQLLDDHHKEIERLSDAMDKNDTISGCITVEDIEGCIRELYSLKLNGKTIRDMMNLQRECRAQNHSSGNETNYVMTEGLLLSKIKMFVDFADL